MFLVEFHIQFTFLNLGIIGVWILPIVPGWGYVLYSIDCRHRPAHRLKSSTVLLAPESRSEAAELAMVEVLFFLYIFRYLHDQIVTTWCNNRGKLLWWLRRWLHALFYASSNRSTLPPAVQQTQFCFFWNADWCFFSSWHRKLLQIQPQILVVCFFFLLFPVMSFNKVPASFCGLYSRYIMYYRECQMWNAI